MILCHFRPEKCQNPTQKDMNFGNTIILRYLRPEKCQNPTQIDTNFGNTIILCYLRQEKRQNPTQKDTNFRNAIILCYLGPENHQIQPQKTRISHKTALIDPSKMAKKVFIFPEFRTVLEMHSLTPSTLTKQQLGNT